MTRDALPRTTLEDDELKVTFYPPLVLQRRIWILDILRAENITEVLDVGCGEGQLLSVLCQPAPWLSPPPPHVLPPPKSSASSDPIPSSPTYNDEIPNLHIKNIVGLDISSSDLAFAIQGTAPPQDEVELNEGSNEYRSYLTNVGLRWEQLEVKLWKGGLEMINEDFVDVECIVSTEVIEHLPPDVFSTFAPMLLGVYHPRLFLVTTPNYTFNARFTAPAAPPSARRGFPDPTHRTDRIFRHDDHKFEWTSEEFHAWCTSVALQWEYEVQISSVGRAVEIDEWGRDEELGGATSVAVFRRLEWEGRENKARDALKALSLQEGAHELVAKHGHLAHSSSEKPKALKEIGLHVRAKMEGFREAFMRVEELWFERDIAVMCGGWIEMLVRAVEECEFLVLKRDGEDMKKERGMWVIELVGGVENPKELWPADGETSLDYIPVDWIPGEEESSEGDWTGSTDMEGDVSWNGSEDDDDLDNPNEWADGGWGGGAGSKRDDEIWGDSPTSTLPGAGWAQAQNLDDRIPYSSGSSTTGWDGDEDGGESDDTT